MVRLHLIGFTTDLKNLIFATRPSAKRGNYMLQIDKRLLGALQEVAKLEAEADAQPHEEQESASTPVVPAAPIVRSSALSPKQIQSLLREGKSEEQVAKLAQTDVSWIHRFTAPIIAERAEVIDSVLAGVVSKPRLGPSAVNVREAVQLNLTQKRIQMDPESFEKAWKASRRGGRWQVAFQYVSRGRRRTARFAFDPDNREVTAANDVALGVGWRPDSRMQRGAGVADGSNRSVKPRPKKTSPSAKKSVKTRAGRKKSSTPVKRKPAANPLRDAANPSRRRTGAGSR